MLDYGNKQRINPCGKRVASGFGDMWQVLMPELVCGSELVKYRRVP